MDVRYHVGSKDDPPGRNGFAHLYEHLMFLGSKKVTESGFTDALEETGVVSYNAGTTQDTTDHHELIPPNALPVALWLEADRMGSPLERLTDASFQREREVVKNEWRQNYDNTPFGHVRSIARASVFPLLE